MEEIVRQLIKQAIEGGYSYSEYRNLVARLVLDGKSTGNEQTEALSNYSMLNERRMKRLDKTIKLSEAVLNRLSKLDRNIIWVVLTESWCGDAAQTLPVIQKFAEASNRIELKVVLRDENEALMNRFLTRGSRSIPKLIMVDPSVSEVIDCWGPRPSIATKMVKEQKEKFGMLSADFKEDLQLWYNKDKGQNTVEDLLELLSLE
ncbi:thioredoxin family protein [Galbibacter sp. BG1]|uniref:thioredoxin family protein n=1 Tax=Galbibacter sp. BG1 TaxID=1170699 RepID=UPI0015BB0D02|nr:thioredoxin family protein [Galbibacter sp. BG1]QLE00731.1 thioredoxin family protein [Galbibacter sp. BG1]